MIITREIKDAWARLMLSTGWQQADNSRVTFRSQIIDGVQYIDFQGSVERVDWLMDFNILPTHWYHGGYFKACVNTFNDLAINTTLPQVWAGYSCGGAFALILASEIGEYIRNSIKVFTFAAPRISWGKPAKWHPNVVIYNVKCKGDPVVYLPPKFLGFRKNRGENNVFWANVKFFEQHLPSTYTKYIEGL